jgi:hypothetical protein
MAGVTLLAGLLLPWLAGMTALVLLRGKRPFSAPGEIAWIAGAGYLVGAFVLTLWMRLLSTAGVGFSALSIAAPLLAATAIAGYLAWRRAFSARTGRRHASRLAGTAGLDRFAFSAAWGGSCVATALPVGCVDPVGDQGARLVRTRPDRPVRER